MYHMGGYKSIENNRQAPESGFCRLGAMSTPVTAPPRRSYNGKKPEVAHMGKDRQLAGPLADQLNNYDLTRKIIALRTMDLMTRLSEAEAAKDEPDLAAIADLGIAIATLLSSVG